VRVLHVTPYFAPAYRYGGPPRSILGLCRALGDAGVDVEVFTTTANGDQPLTPAPGGVVHEGVRVRYFPLTWPRRYWRAGGLRSALKKAATGADLVHVHGLWNMTSWAGVAAARAAGKPYIVSPRGMLQPEARQRHREMKSLAYWGIERANLRDATLLHATSALEGRELTQYGPPVMLIPNGVNVRHASAASVDALRVRAGLEAGNEVVTFLGRLHPIKRLDLLAEAFAIVHHARPNARLIIAGPDEGGYRQHVEAMFAPVSHATRWLGAVDDEAIAALLASTDVLVQCSDSESFGMSVAEALSAGVPVVVTRQSGWAEINAIGCGFSVAHDPVSIADGILRVLDHADRTSLCARANAWARKTFAWEVIGTSMRDAYAQAISRAAKRVA
jgi:glycosyltransferase involved in cell wall biosynthesis